MTWEGEPVSQAAEPGSVHFEQGFSLVGVDKRPSLPRPSPFIMTKRR